MPPVTATPTTLYDGSLAGLLSVVFQVFDNGLVVERLERACRYVPGMFGHPVEVATNEAHARRVWAGLDRHPPFDKELVLRCWLFDTTQSDSDILHLLVRLFREGFAASEDYRDEAIFRCRQVHKKMFREIHRTHAFVRFAEAEDGLYFARIDPDFDVLPLAVEHFEQRYQDQEWLIWDGRRHYGFWFTPGFAKAQRVNLPDEEGYDASPHPSNEQPASAHDDSTALQGLPSAFAKTPHDPATQAPHEDGFQQLWGTYWHSVNIEARKNPKLHLQHVPRRYWRHLTEKRAP